MNKNEKILNNLGNRVVKRSPEKQVLLALVSITLLFLSIWHLQTSGERADPQFWQILGWLGVCVFSAYFMIISKSFFFGENTGMMLSSTGLHLKNASDKEIPWSTIAVLSVWTHKYNSLIRLQLYPDGYRLVNLKIWAQITRLMHKPVGLEGIYISSADLDLSFNELFDLLAEYLETYNSDAKIVRK